MLSLVDKDLKSQTQLILASTSCDLTPLDIAGRNKSNEVALLFLDYFKKNFDIIMEVFDDESQKLNSISNDDSIEFKDINENELNYPWLIYRMRENKLNEL